MYKTVVHIVLKHYEVKVYCDESCETNPYKCFVFYGVHQCKVNEFCCMESVMIWLSGLIDGNLLDDNENKIVIQDKNGRPLTHDEKLEGIAD